MGTIFLVNKKIQHYVRGASSPCNGNHFLVSCVAIEVWITPSIAGSKKKLLIECMFGVRSSNILLIYTQKSMSVFACLFHSLTLK